MFSLLIFVFLPGQVLLKILRDKLHTFLYFYKYDNSLTLLFIFISMIIAFLSITHTKMHAFRRSRQCLGITGKGPHPPKKQERRRNRHTVFYETLFLTYDDLQENNKNDFNWVFATIAFHCNRLLSKTKPIHH